MQQNKIDVFFDMHVQNKDGFEVCFLCIPLAEKNWHTIINLDYSKIWKHMRLKRKK